LGVKPDRHQGLQDVRLNHWGAVLCEGVAYQPRDGGPHDPLNTTDCLRDAKLLREMGANTIRVYETYPWLDHTKCMSALEECGIYVMLDLAIPTISINREQPSYDTTVLVHYKQKVDAFARFPNTLAFLAGNEVTNDAKTTPASAHIKAALRDIKKYISTKSRTIPVGYADNDDPAIRNNIQDYFNCGDDADRADFYGINIYSWCGKSTFQQSGFDKRTSELSDYDRPVLLTEYGCNKGERRFDEIISLYGKDMQDVFSGGIVYEYSQEDNSYGLVHIKNTKAELLKDYSTVKEKFAKVKPKAISMASYQPRHRKRQCPKAACDCAFSTLTCRVNEKGELKENGEKVGEMVGTACGDGHCELIEADTAKGNYGPFSFCNATVRNSIVFSQAVNNGAKCSFDGFTDSVKVDSNTNLNQCSKLIPNLKTSTSPSKPKGFVEVDKKRPSYTEEGEGSKGKRGRGMGLLRPQLLIIPAFPSLS
ncbi:1 3-beta-glucanosyltransferase gel4, partial [Massospora cicadina]